MCECVRCEWRKRNKLAMAVVCLTPFFCLTFLLRSRARVCVLQPVTLALLQGLVALFNYIGAYSRWAVKKKKKKGGGGAFCCDMLRLWGGRRRKGRSCLGLLFVSVFVGVIVRV